MNLSQTMDSLAALAIEARSIAGLKVTIEVPAGEIRKGKDKHGRPWQVRMPFPYGRIQGTKGMDGECVDAIIGPVKNPKKVWVIGLPIHHGNEDKVMLGFASKDQALRAFLRCYQHKKKFLGHVSEMSIDRLQRKLQSRRGRRISAMYETSPWSNYQYQGFDPVPPKDTVSRSDEGYKPRDAFEELEEKLRKDPKNKKFYEELTRRLGAKTISQSSVSENWPTGGMDGLP